MDKKRKFQGCRVSGSFTIEAAYVCVVTLLVLGALIRQGFVVHDRTAANMILHETVEMGRRLEKERPLEEVRAAGQSQTWLLYGMDYRLNLVRDGERVKGVGSGGDFQNDISVSRFDPESFLRMIEGISGLGGREDGD